MSSRKYYLGGEPLIFPKRHTTSVLKARLRRIENGTTFFQGAREKEHIIAELKRRGAQRDSLAPKTT